MPTHEDDDDDGGRRRSSAAPDRLAASPSTSGARRSSMSTRIPPPHPRRSISPPPLRNGKDARRHRHAGDVGGGGGGMDAGRPTGAGYYVPPPGYSTDPLHEHGRSPWPPRRHDREDDEEKPRRGSFDPHWHRYDRRIPRSPDVNKDRHVPADVDSRCNLSHHDWTVPQAKQILSHWATLATLLAGVQATLLTFYNKNEGAAAETDSTYRVVVAISCAGLFLEVYGALLAAGTIIASIALQASTPPMTTTTTATASAYDDGGEPLMRQMPHLHLAGHHSSSLLFSMPAAAPTPLSPRARAVLDRMAVLTGFIVPFGAVCELAGLAAYAVYFLGPPVALTIFATIAALVGATVVAGCVGLRAGTRVMQHTVTHHHI